MIFDQFKKVQAGYNKYFLVGKNLDFYRYFHILLSNKAASSLRTSLNITQYIDYSTKIAYS